MDLDIAQFALVIYGAVFALACVAIAILLAVFFWKDPSATTAVIKTFYDGGNGLRIVTVVAVLATATVLAFGGHLSEGVLSLLSGVAGFVLGGLRPGEKTAESVIPPAVNRAP
jgi:hypothetical protein